MELEQADQAIAVLLVMASAEVLAEMVLAWAEGK
jgi:hypothetical protein